MATLQVSETQVACRRHDPKNALTGMGLTKAPGATQQSNVQVTKMKAGCSGRVFVMVKASAGTCTVKLKAEADESLSFASGTVDIPVNDTEAVWGSIAVNGDTAKYWGIEVNGPAGGLDWTDFVILETSEIDLAAGENYDVCSAAFNAKKVSGTGDVPTAFPV